MRIALNIQNGTPMKFNACKISKLFVFYTKWHINLTTDMSETRSIQIIHFCTKR